MELIEGYRAGASDRGGAISMETHHDAVLRSNRVQLDQPISLLRGND